MADLASIVSLFRDLISQETEATSDITAAEAANFANQAARFTAIKSEWPRDSVEVQAELGKPVIAMPTDFLNVILAYFGDASLQNDVIRLKIFNEKELASVNPAWRSTNSANYGKPRALMLLNRNEVFLYPPPDADSSAAGKKLYMTYVYYPAVLSADADVPDLPAVYHDLLPFYMAHLAYAGKLKNPEIANNFFKNFLDKLKLVEMPTEREKDQLNWFLDGNYNIYSGLDYENGGIIP